MTLEAVGHVMYTKVIDHRHHGVVNGNGWSCKKEKITSKTGTVTMYILALLKHTCMYRYEY